MLGTKRRARRTIKEHSKGELEPCVVLGWNRKIISVPGKEEENVGGKEKGCAKLDVRRLQKKGLLGSSPLGKYIEKQTYLGRKVSEGKNTKNGCGDFGAVTKSEGYMGG